MSMVTTAAVVGIGSGVVGIAGGISQAKAAKKAGKRADPFGPWRKMYAEQLQKLMQDPSSFATGGLFQYVLDQGTQAVARGMAKGGGIGSGNMALGLQQFGMGAAHGALQDERRFLAELAGAGVAPNYGPSLAGRDSGMEMIGGGLRSLGEGLLGFGGSSPVPGMNTGGGGGGNTGGLGSFFGVSSRGG